MHKHRTQDVLSGAGKVIALICRGCLVVLCKSCRCRVYVADDQREWRLCRCNTPTAGKR